MGKGCLFGIGFVIGLIIAGALIAVLGPTIIKFLLFVLTSLGVTV